jgi:hypothetical protein
LAHGVEPVTGRRPLTPASLTRHALGRDDKTMTGPQRCLVIVPADAPDLYARLVAAFIENPQVFVSRDRRLGDRALRSVEIFAVGGGELDPGLRKVVDDELRRLGVRR